MLFLHVLRFVKVDKQDRERQYKKGPVDLKMQNDTMLIQGEIRRKQDFQQFFFSLPGCYTMCSKVFDGWPRQSRPIDLER